jgi:hypothetical protein
MNSKDLAGFSQIAFAAYFDLIAGRPKTDSLEDSGKGMSASQAKQFSDAYTVLLPTQSDPISGLDLTVFKDLKGNITLALRGTTPGIDLLIADTQIALHGAAYGQIVALYNWWQRAVTPATRTVQQFKFVEYPTPAGTPAPAGAVKLYASGFAFGGQSIYLVPDAPVLGNGQLLGALAADPDLRVDVVGHSLGGHLAMAFNALFGGTYVGQATTFNAPGFLSTPVNQQFFAALGGAVPSNANAGNVTNVVADQARVGTLPWSAIAGLHSRPGNLINIAIENQWLSDEPSPETAYNHSMKVLADSLAVQQLLATLDAGVTPANYKAMLAAAAPQTAASYERVVDALESLLGINAANMPYGNTQRELLYQALYNVQGNNDYKALTGKVSLTLSTRDLKDQAKTDFGAMASLLALSPIQLSGGAELNSALRKAWNSAHALWTNDKDKLTQAQRDAGEENFTDAYRADRAALLAALVRYNTSDATDGLLPFGSAPIAYQDLGTNLSLKAGNNNLLKQLVKFGGATTDTLSGDVLGDRLYGGAGADNLTGQAGADYLEGNAGDDKLDGGSDADTLLGGSGDDVLTGGKDNDLLLGGLGNDTYQFEADWGHDIIDDADGKGSLTFKGNPLDGSGTVKVAEGAWLYTNTSANTKTRYTLADDTLVITQSDKPDSIVIRHWSSSKNLGLTNLPGTLKEPPEPATTVVGDFIKKSNPENGAYVITSTGGTYNYVNAGLAKDAADVLNGDALANKISGLGGNDGMADAGSTLAGQAANQLVLAMAA